MSRLACLAWVLLIAFSFLDCVRAAHRWYWRSVWRHSLLSCRRPARYRLTKEQRLKNDRRWKARGWTEALCPSSNIWSLFIIWRGVLIRWWNDWNDLMNRRPDLQWWLLISMEYGGEAPAWFWSRRLSLLMIRKMLKLGCLAPMDTGVQGTCGTTGWPCSRHCIGSKGREQSGRWILVNEILYLSSVWLWFAASLCHSASCSTGQANHLVLAAFWVSGWSHCAAALDSTVDNLLGAVIQQFRVTEATKPSVSDISSRRNACNFGLS